MPDPNETDTVDTSSVPLIQPTDNHEDHGGTPHDDNAADLQGATDPAIGLAPLIGAGMPSSTGGGPGLAALGGALLGTGQSPLSLGDPSLTGDEQRRNPPPEELPQREDGPTLAEWIAAGYAEGNYPPKGYAARETRFRSQAEIDAEAAAARDESKN